MASIPMMSVAHTPPSCDIQKCLHTLPNATDVGQSYPQLIIAILYKGKDQNKDKQQSYYIFMTF